MKPTFPHCIFHITNEIAISDSSNGGFLIWKLSKQDNSFVSAESLHTLEEACYWSATHSSNDHPYLMQNKSRIISLIDYFKRTSTPIEIPSLKKLSFPPETVFYCHPFVGLKESEIFLVLNVETCQELWRINSATSSDYFLCSRNKVVQCGDLSLTIRNVQTGEILTSCDSPKIGPSRCCINDNFFTVAQQNNVWVHSLDSGQCVSKFSIAASTVGVKPYISGPIRSLSCNNNKIAINTDRGFPIILHFDEIDYPPVNIVEISPSAAAKIHTATPYELYDTIGTLMEGNLQNLHQFIVWRNQHEPTNATERVYMVAAVSQKDVVSPLLPLDINKAASDLLLLVNEYDEHPNILQPVFQKHTVPAPNQTGYQVRGSAFFFKEIRDGLEKPWMLFHLTVEEVKEELDTRSSSRFENFTFSEIQ